MLKRLLMVFVCLLVGQNFVLAEGGLYDSPPPLDSAYVRVIDASDSPEPEVSVGGIPVEVPKTQVSPYVLVKAGAHQVEYAGNAINVRAEAGSFTTVVVGLSGSMPMLVLHDDVLTNPAKAGLYFYNLSDERASLDVEIKDKSATVFKDVAPGEAKFREVAPFEVSLVVRQGEASSVVANSAVLESRSGTSLVYFKAGSPTNVLVKNSVQR